MPDINTRLSKAKTTVMLEHPFWGSLIMNMPFHLDENIPTACTNGQWIKFNPHFLADKTDENIKWILAHEIAHPMFDHCTRRGDRDPYKWNEAGDYVINQVLEDEKIGVKPSGVLFDPDLYKKGDGITDRIYNLLPDTPEDEQGFGGEGQPMDDVQDGGLSQAEIAEQEAIWKVKVAQAAQAATTADCGRVRRSSGTGEGNVARGGEG